MSSVLDGSATVASDDLSTDKAVVEGDPDLVDGELSADLGGVTAGAFTVHLDEFDGPFDLLLSLIAKRRLDVTVLALHEVTDDFVSYLRERGSEYDLNEVTEFLVVAATLLDLKAARLLPSGEVEDEEDLALLEARDVLFARLLQYRAFKEAARHFSLAMGSAGRRTPRTVGLDPKYAGMLPEVLLGLNAESFAALAARAMAPKVVELVATEHVHAAKVSVREQAAYISDRLRRSGSASFRALCRDTDSTLVIVGRFLALLELFREGLIAFDQAIALGELHVRWTGGDGDVADVVGTIDEAEYGDAGPLIPKERE